MAPRSLPLGPLVCGAGRLSAEDPMCRGDSAQGHLIEKGSHLTPHPESWGSDKEDENHQLMQTHTSGPHVYVQAQPMMAKWRYSRRDSHWAKRKMQEIKFQNGTDKHNVRKGLSAPWLAGRATLGKSHKPLMTRWPKNSKLNQRKLISFGFSYFEFSFPCAGVLISVFMIFFFFFLIYYSVIIYHLLKTVLGAFRISHSFSPDYTLRRYMLFLLYALNMLEVSQLTEIKRVPYYIPMVQRTYPINTLWPSISVHMNE